MAIIDSREAEQSVLGCMLIENKILSEVFSFLVAEDFKYSEHGNIFTACKVLHTQNIAVDPITVIGQLGSTPEHRVFIVNLVQLVPSVQPYKEYMRIVKDCSKRRGAYQLTANLLTSLNDNEPLQDCLTTVCDIAQSLNDSKGDASCTANEGFAMVYAELDKPRQYLQTGFYKLDRDIKISRGDYIVVAGRPSTGKTALTLQIMLNMAKTHKVVYFSLETGKRQIFGRLMATHSGTPLEQIKTGQVTDYQQLVQSADRFGKLNFSVVEAAGWTVDQIQAEAVRQGAGVIFIDYISLIKGRGKSQYEQVTNISIDLHTMAQSRKIAVVALSQLNREGTGEPALTHLRESGQLEQDADAVIMLYLADEQDKKGRRVLKIAKNKEGVCGKWELEFYGAQQRFAEVNTKYV